MKRIYKYKILLLISSLFFFSHTEFAQYGQKEIDLPFVKNFTSKEYKAHGQNFAIAQDDRGLIYSANFSGILEYDGAVWRTIPTSLRSKATAIAKDKNGRLFVGARNEFGYLSVNKTNGSLYYVNISNKLKKNDRDFTEIISVFATNSGIIFVSEKAVYEYKNNSLNVIYSDGNILSTFYVNNVLYCYVKDKGLKRLFNNCFVPVEGMGAALPSLEFYTMLPLKDGSALIGSGNMGLYTLNGSGLRKFICQADDFFIKNKITCGVALANGDLAIGTNRGGIAIITQQGVLRKIIDQNTGMQNESVQALFVDRNNSLWAALNNGISLIELQSPVSYISDNITPKGGITSMLRLGNKLFVGSYRGLSYLQDNSGVFKSINGITTASWALLNIDNSVLAATSEGIYQVINDNAFPLTKDFALCLYRSKKEPTTVYAGQTNGVSILKAASKKITQVGALPGFNKEVRAIAEDDNGLLWICTPFNGIYMYSPYDKKTEHYDTSKGLPSLIGNNISEVNGKIYFTTQYGIYVFDNSQHKFKRDFSLISNSSKTEWTYKIVADRNGNIITNNGEETDISFYNKTASGKLVKNTPLLLPVSDFITWTIYPDADNKIWFGGPDGLLLLDLNIPAKYDNNFSALIRKVKLNSGKEVFSGAFFNEALIQNLIQDNTFIPSIDYSDNTICFEFGAASFSAKSNNQYQYMLEGFDKSWSQWSNSYSKEYTNLPEGRYVFKVRAKNANGLISKEASFQFRINVPWYRAWYAYLLYILILSGGVFSFVRIRSRQLEKEKRILEKLVEERTTEVVKQKEEIEEKSNELSDKNDELEKINQIVKSINSEIHFANLLQSILNQALVIKGIEKAAILVHDKSANVFKFKASYNWDDTILNPVKLTLEEAEQIYLKNTNEVYEDIFCADNFRMIDFGNSNFRFEKSASMIVLLVKVEDKTEGFLILENIRRKDAFTNKDILFIKNLKEHIIAAFIKTKILEDLQVTLDNLQDTQDKLVQSEKLASLGQLTAGIAHEIKNPLNFINNFSDLSKGIIEELSEELAPVKEKIPEKDLDYIEELFGDLKHNLIKINEHGKRVDSIVKGMLLHSRGKSGEFQKSSINSLLSEFISLAYHGFRAQDSTFNVKIETLFDESIEMINVVPQNLSRVFINILNNACYSTNEKKKEKGAAYSPVLTITTKNLADKVEIRIRDNGKGIPKEILDRIFNPFFTTKPAGKGTGLGLSLSYDIINGEHKGEIRIESEEGEFAEFIILIPKNLVQGPAASQV